MKVIEDSKNTDYIFNLNEGDVFVFDDEFYIACAMDNFENYREVFDVKYNLIIRFSHNSLVKVWRSENVKLVLEEVKQ